MDRVKIDPAWKPLAGKAQPKGNPPAPPRGHRFAAANAAVVIAGVEALPVERKAREAAVQRLIPTDDPSDRAHGVRDQAIDMLRPARLVANAKPRRYFPCHIQTVERGGRVVRMAIDSVFDQTYQIARELAEAGIELGVVRAADARQEALEAMSAARDATRPKTRAKLDDAERALLREGSRLLNEAKKKIRGVEMR